MNPGEGRCRSGRLLLLPAPLDLPFASSKITQLERAWSGGVCICARNVFRHSCRSYSRGEGKKHQISIDPKWVTDRIAIRANREIFEIREGINMSDNKNASDVRDHRDYQH